MRKKSIVIAGILLTLATGITACSGKSKATETTTAVSESSENTAESTSEAPTGEQTGVYTIYNGTGEAVSSITITDKSDNQVVAKSGKLAEGENVELTLLANASQMESKEYILAFATESGYSASYDTLRFETVPITLLAADAMTGPTPIVFEALAE